MKPLAIDLFCGLGGWTEGLLAEGYDVEGYDIEAHEYGDEKYPGRLVLADVMTLHGSQFRHASLIVASPPCQEFSFMAMPWTRAKQIARGLRGEGEFPPGYKGSRTIAELTALFDACFRIQREASAAAGRHIPMVVENVRGAVPWVGREAWNFGSYYLWGDVPALMPYRIGGQKFNPDGTTAKIAGRRTPASASMARAAAFRVRASTAITRQVRAASLRLPRRARDRRRRATLSPRRQAAARRAKQPVPRSPRSRSRCRRGLRGLIPRLTGSYRQA